ncbi:MAG TPA: HAMP domain-containing protein [Planctomycetes bacterium]|nr:HAMP domain-containing protein [Planctomycetota bacterium]
MSRQRSDGDLRLKGLGLGARFALSMTIALTVVLGITGGLLYSGLSRISENRMTTAFSEAVRFSRDVPPTRKKPGGFLHRSGVRIQEFTYRDGKKGTVYTYGDAEDPLGKAELWVPDTETGASDLLRLLVAVLTVVVLVGAAVSYWVAGKVTKPVLALIEDVRRIAKGELKRRTTGRGEGEIELLARSIDRMSADLEEARRAEVELSIRKREREVAAGVREALLPLATPMLDGFDVGAAFLAGPDFGGDFHDFIERADGTLGLLVCGVSGNGIPAALVGATARSYLRGELERCEDPVEAFRRVNRWLHGDIRPGMYVTALYALLDPAVGRAQVLCAGHRVPLLRFDATEGAIRVVHPEGIALGFDKGPVFDRSIQLVETPIEPGDRFLLSNAGPVELHNPEGRELGEKAFYARVLKHGELETTDFLKSLRRDLETFAGPDGLDRDISLVTVRREP